VPGPSSAAGGQATLGGGDDNLSLWNRIASVLPLLVLLAGLVPSTWSRTTAAPAKWPKSTPPCSPTTCRRPPTPTPVSSSSSSPAN
jgi:hypothetical protein